MTKFTKDNISAWRIWGEPPGYVEESFEEIERLQARVQELEQERRWISVEERLPEEHEYVLLWDRYNILVGNYVFDKDKPNWCDATSLNDIYPTHWLPLPQPPESED